MSRPLVTFTDPERAIVDYLDVELAGDAGTAYPTGSTGAAFDGYTQVGWDGTPGGDYPVRLRTTVRVTAWASNPTPAKDAALALLGTMQCHPGDLGVWAVTYLTGPHFGKDPDSKLYFAYSTFRVSVRPTAA